MECARTTDKFKEKIMNSEIKSAISIVCDLRKKGMSQVRISKALGCTQAAVSRWQSGKRLPEGDWMPKLEALWKEKCGA